MEKEDKIEIRTKCKQCGFVRRFGYRCPNCGSKDSEVLNDA